MPNAILHVTRKHFSQRERNLGRPHGGREHRNRLVSAKAARIDLARTAALGHAAHATVTDGWRRIDGGWRRQVERRRQEHGAQEDDREAEKDGWEEHRAQEDDREEEDD